MGFRVATASLAAFAIGCWSIEVPSINVPACNTSQGTIHYNTSVPDSGPFPETKVLLCYDDKDIHLTFEAFGPDDAYVNTSLVNNDDIYDYTVMEAFISRGTADPQTYLEFEVAPNNVTFSAFIYNPSKVRADGAPFETYFIEDPVASGITSNATISPGGYSSNSLVWSADVRISFGLFNVDDGEAKDTQWRMGLFRTIYDPDTKSQSFGAWSVPDELNFHMTPYLGNVNFV